MHKQKISGFTIVELLIVIVVIAILASITIVAYNGIQQRANNTKTIAAVNQVIKSIQGYIAVNDTYPATWNACLVPADDGSCTAYVTTPNYTMSPTLTNNLKTISTLASTVPNAHTAFNGITYNYYATRTFNGEPRPVAVIYSLRGDQQKCGIANVANNGGATMLPSSVGYTGSDSGFTYCFISISGPSS